MAEERKETPSLAKVMQDMVDKQLMDVHTSMPGTIISYDYASNMAVIQPSLKRKFKQSSSSINLPPISNVPVCFPSVGKAHIRFPLNSGDEGEIVFQERSIDKWLSLGGTIDPEDTRKFHLSDAIFFPGKLSSKNSYKSKAKKTSIEIKNDKSWIEVYPNGKFKLTDGTEELFDLLVQLCQAILDARTNTIFGPQPLINLQNQFFVIRQKLEKMRGQ